MICRLLCAMVFSAWSCFPGRASAQNAPVTAEELVRKVLQARGGVPRIKAVQAERVSGTISLGPGAEGPFSVELKRPERLRMEVVIQDQTVVRTYDGRGSAWLVNPFGADKGPVAMTGDDLKNIAEEADFDGPLVDYQSKGNKIELLGKDEVNGKPVIKLKLTTKGADVRTYYFDSATYLLLKWEGVRKSADQDVPVESFFSDYRDINGLKFAFQIDSDSPGSDRTQKLRIEKIELNPQVDDARFGKPAEPSAADPTATAPAKEKPERR